MFDPSGIKIYQLWGLWLMLKIRKENITAIYVRNTPRNFLRSLLMSYRGINLGNRFTRKILVVETKGFVLKRYFLTPKDPLTVMTLLGFRNFT